VVQNADEKRGYMRGYSRAGARSWDRVRRVIAVARAYKTRLSDTDTSRICMTCDRWTRGGESSSRAESCKWGVCRADFEWGIEARMWAELPLGAPRSLKPQIITQPEFGCVSWIPTKPAQR
jgi:hypothetical protein